LSLEPIDGGKQVCCFCQQPICWGQTLVKCRDRNQKLYVYHKECFDNGMIEKFLRQWHWRVEK